MDRVLIKVKVVSADDSYGSRTLSHRACPCQCPSRDTGSATPRAMMHTCARPTASDDAPHGAAHVLVHRVQRASGPARSAGSGGYPGPYARKSYHVPSYVTMHLLNTLT